MLHLSGVEVGGGAEHFLDSIHCDFFSLFFSFDFKLLIVQIRKLLSCFGVA